MDSTELVAELTRKVLKANILTRSDLFLRFSGHVYLIDLDIHEEGWQCEQDPTYSCSAYLENTKGIKEMIQEVDRLLEEKCLA